MTKKITNEQLAIIIQKGFKEARVRTDEQFQESDTRTDKKIDDLARMTQKGFEDIQSRMATKEELFETREILAQAIKDLDMRMSAYANFNKEEIDRLKSWMQSIEERVSFLEHKKLVKK